MTEQARERRFAAAHDMPASTIWQAVKSFGNYSKWGVQHDQRSSTDANHG